MCEQWPDEIRRHHNRYDLPLWHHIDYPLRPPAFAMEAAPSGGNNVVFGIRQAEKVLKDPNASAEPKAAHLFWLIHLVGDVHQPLHCASYFSPEFPRGDKGGNSFYVKPDSRAIKLHSFWMGCLVCVPAAYSNELRHTITIALSETRVAGATGN